MALRNILTEGDPALKKPSRKVKDFDKRLHQLIDDMRETLEDAGGVGLAAPQVGILRSVVVVLDLAVSEEEPEKLRFIELINPEMVETEGEQTGLEGCLSVPGFCGIVRRPQRVRVKAQDRYGEYFFAEGEDMMARAFCHELDHLEGKLFLEIADQVMTNEAALEMEQEQEDDTQDAEG